MIISVSIRLCKGDTIKTLKNFGLIECEDRQTIAEVYKLVSTGVLNSGDSFVSVSSEYSEYPLRAEIAEGEGGKFQSVPLHLQIKGAAEFGKYFRFNVLEECGSNTLKERTPSKSLPNAFEALMTAQKRKVWPKFKNIERPNKKYELHNKIVRWLQDMGLGWDLAAASLGENFVAALCNQLWHLDPHRPKLAERGCAVPEYWDQFKGFNIPAAHSHIPKRLDRDELTTMTQQMFGVLEQVQHCFKAPIIFINKYNLKIY